VKSGLVVVAGRPNVGKSTLVNALCGEKVAITSNVPNTTRRRIFGAATGLGYQLVLAMLPFYVKVVLDVPGNRQGTWVAILTAIAIAVVVVSIPVHRRLAR